MVMFTSVTTSLGVESGFDFLGINWNLDVLGDDNFEPGLDWIFFFLGKRPRWAG